MNFPPQLAIRASNPGAALGHFTSNGSVSESENFVLDDEPLISSQSTDIKSYGIAGRVWEAAYAMSLYLQPPRTWEFEPECSVSRGHDGAIVELGSGTGFLGFRLARMLSLRPDPLDRAPKSLILTDMESVCPLLHRNGQIVAKDVPGVDLVIRPLEWGNQEHGHALATGLTMGTQGNALLSHIVCSDLVYFPELFAPLLRTLLQLSSKPFSTTSQPVQVIISYMIRSLTKESPFWSAFGTWFDFLPVLVRQGSESTSRWERFGGHKEGLMFIFVATRKPESLGLPVPDEDSDLMRGGDETFETLLLMNIATE